MIVIFSNFSIFSDFCNDVILFQISYVAELMVEGECVVFLLPGNMAPWKRDSALEQTTQSDVEKVKIQKER